MKGTRRGMTRRTFIKAGATAASAGALSAGLTHHLVFADANATLRVGVIGCGKRGAQAIQACGKVGAGLQVVALADAFQDRIDAVKGGTKVANDHCFAGLDSAAKLLALKDVDAVVLASPPAFLPRQFAAAIEAGKHVYLEAPAAICFTGVKLVKDTAANAQAKKLSVVSGLNGRHDPAVVETMKRIHDGAIGTIQSAQCYCCRGPIETVKREANDDDLRYQLRNWHAYEWLSGDLIVEHHIHNLDILNWAFQSTPESLQGLGGRQSNTGEEFGNIYDHFGVEFVYPNDIRTISLTRFMNNTEERIGEHLAGMKGVSDGRGIIEGQNAWKYAGAKVDPLVQALTDLVKGVQAGTPVNDGQAAADSALTAVMGRESTYTRIQFKRAYFESKCTLDLLPPQDLKFGPLPIDPVAIPGQYTIDGFGGSGGRKKKG